MKSNIAKRVGLIACALLVLTAGVALAYSEVTVNGHTYGCQNSCVVTTYSGGGWLVKDSKGGWIKDVDTVPET